MDEMRLDQNERLVIIPAAGFGTRLKITSSKELLINPLTGLNFIDSSIDLARSWKADVLIISREDKIDLNTYLQEKEAQDIELFLIKSSFEWTQSVYLSHAKWRKYNVVLLPDVAFAPLSIGENIFCQLKTVSFCAAVFKVKEADQWGIVEEKDQQLWIAEKPQMIDKIREYEAWGLLGFHLEQGIKFFEAYQKSSLNHLFVSLACSYNILNLEFFKDLTRGE